MTRWKAQADRFVPHGLASAIFILMTLLFSMKAQLMLTDTDFWWHLSAGDLIRQSGAIPAHDVFSFTAGSYPWLNISWAWDALYSFLYQQHGYLPLLFTAKLNALTLAILTTFLLNRGVGPVVTIATILFCLIPYSYMLTPRPHQVTFLMTIIFYVLSHNAVTNKSFKPLIVLPFLMVVWVNSHGGFIVGFIVFGAYIVQIILKAERKNLINFIAVFFACLLATLINPLGIHIFAACNRTLSSALIPIISEWQPLQFNFKYLLHLAYVFLFLITFNWVNPNTTIAEKLLSIIWAVAALQHERNLPIFVLLSAPVLALDLKYLISGKFKRWVMKKDEIYHKDFSKPKVRCWMFGLALLLTVILFSGGGKILIEAHTPPTHPIEEIAYFKLHYQNRRILNDYFQGGYLLNKLEGSSKIFIDGRAETAYPPAVVNDYLEFYNNSPGWDKILSKYAIDAIIIPRSASQNYFLSTLNGWQKVLSGHQDNIYVKL